MKQHNYNKIIKLWKKTKIVRMSYRDVAKAVGCSLGTVQNAVRDYTQKHKKTAIKSKSSV